MIPSSTVTPPAQPPGGAPPPVTAVHKAIPVALWGALILGAHLWGGALLRAGRPLHLPSPPLYANFGPRLSLRIVPALGVAAVMVAGAGRAAQRLPWRRLLVAVVAAGAAWAAALALADGWHALAAPLLGPDEYLRNLPDVGSAGSFLAGFTRSIDGYATHVRAHPPGMLLLLHALTRIGLGSPSALALVVVLAGASAGAAALVVLREVAGEAAARRAAPFLALAPMAVWIATSADALFAGVGAWGIALTVLATGDRRRRGALAFAGGVLLGAAVFLSYGLVLLAAVPVAVAAWRRRPSALAVAAAGAGLVAAAFASQGFLWWEGLRATRIQYHSGAAADRPYGFFLVADLAVLAVALGPACAAALGRLRDRRVWLVGSAGLSMIAAAALSGMSKGEVERIWLPFMPWILVAAAALPSPQARPGKAWLAAQAATALVVQALFRTVW